MRFMVFVKENAAAEAGVLPDPEIFERMGKFNEEMVAAGIMLAGEGLTPSSQGVRIKFDGDQRVVTDGPFPETNDLVAGFWMLEVPSKDEVIEWMKRAPFGGGAELEIRQIAEFADLGDAISPELIEAEQRLRAQIEQRQHRP